MALALLRRHQIDAARIEARSAVSQLDLLYASKPANKSLRLAAINALLVSAEISAAANDGAAARRTCRQALGMVPQVEAASLDFQILDPWVRVNTCLGNYAAAEEAVRRLHSIGYRDAEYLRYLSQQRTKGES
jgi:hypothetical protein